MLFSYIQAERRTLLSFLLSLKLKDELLPARDLSLQSSHCRECDITGFSQQMWVKIQLTWRFAAMMPGIHSDKPQRERFLSP